MQSIALNGRFTTLTLIVYKDKIVFNSKRERPSFWNGKSNFTQIIFALGDSQRTFITWRASGPLPTTLQREIYNWCKIIIFSKTHKHMRIFLKRLTLHYFQV